MSFSSSQYIKDHLLQHQINYTSYYKSTFIQALYRPIIMKTLTYLPNYGILGHTFMSSMFLVQEQATHFRNSLFSPGRHFTNPFYYGALLL